MGLKYVHTALSVSGTLELIRLVYQLGGIHTTYDINRILAALPDGQLQYVTFTFADRGLGERNVTGVPSDRVTGENAQISLARFTRLDQLKIFVKQPEGFEALQEILRSWRPTEAPPRRLVVHLSWEVMQSVISPGEETGSARQNISVLEESCGGMFPLCEWSAFGVVHL